MKRNVLLSIVLFLGACFSAAAIETASAAGPPLPMAYAGRYGYGPGWAYSTYYGGPVYYYYSNPNAMLPRAPIMPVYPSYGFTYNNFYPGVVYNYGWYVHRY